MRIHDSTEIKTQTSIFWFGFAFPFVYGLGLGGIAGFLPPSDPSFSANEIYQLYQQNTVSILMGMVVDLIASVLMIPWAIMIWAQIRRLEAGVTPVWSLFQVLAGTLNVVFFTVPTFLWMSAAFVVKYRTGISPEIVQVIHDIAWIGWFVTYPVTSAQCVILAYVGLRDKRPQPLFPRWWCYMQYWVGLCYVPAGFVPFFVKGPFSWDGIVGFGVPVCVYGVWFPLTAWGIYRAIKTKDKPIALSNQQLGETDFGAAVST